MSVGPERQHVAPVAEQSEPFGVAHDDVELVAMHDEVAPAVGANVDDVALDGDSAEVGSAEFAQSFVMIARNEDQFGAFAGFAQQFLQHVVMALRPIYATLDPPEIDDVADEIDARRLAIAQEVEEGFGLTGLGTEMDVRDEDRPIPSRPIKIHVSPPLFHNDVRDLSQSRVTTMGQSWGAWLSPRRAMRAKKNRPGTTGPVFPAKRAKR